MGKKIFINLPVADLGKSMAFYTSLGFVNNPMFTDETAACMVLTDAIHVMLLTHTKFGEFACKKIADTKTSSAVIHSISTDTLEEADSMADAALEAGGTEPSERKDYGFMQQRSFADPDGHHWEVIYMDMSKIPAEMQAAEQ